MLETVKRWLGYERKTAGAGMVVGLARAAWMPPSFDAYAREGYGQNVYVYACVRRLAMACAGAPWLVYRDDARGRTIEAPDAPLARVLHAPNPETGWARLMEEIVSSLMLAGNAYLHATPPAQELRVLRPDRVEVLPGTAVTPVRGYRYAVEGVTRDIPAGQVLHLKTYHPLDAWYGLPPLMAAARSVDQNNASRAWNVALLQNSACPSGVLSSSESLSDKQFADIRGQVRERYQSAGNAGTPMILQGGLKWERLSLSPEDMCWRDGLTLSAREIAVAFGVPPELIGDTANKTYSNYAEARRAFYTETVLPLLDWLRDELNRWLPDLFPGPRCRLDYDHDGIEALQEDRERLWRQAIQAVTAGILTRAEARALLGYSE